MVPLGDEVMVPPAAPMDQVMAKLEDGEAGRVLVAEDGEVVGIITPSDLTRWLRRWRAIDTTAPDNRTHDSRAHGTGARRADGRSLDRR
jgi:hypothetical protein